MTSRYTLTVELSEADLQALLAAAAGAGFSSASPFVRALFGHVVDGVVRPGSWERSWLRQVSWDLESFVELLPGEVHRHRATPPQPVQAAVQADPGLVCLSAGELAGGVSAVVPGGEH